MQSFRHAISHPLKEQKQTQIRSTGTGYQVDSPVRTGTRLSMAGIVDVVEFDLGDERYALDISLVREIVEMMQITPIPRAPSHITGVINLRGEITNIMNLDSLLGLPVSAKEKAKKIIVFMPEAAGGNNVGILVDNVSSVTSVSEDQVEKTDAGVSVEQSRYIKGIIKLGGDGSAGGARSLVLWLDLKKVLADVANK